MDPKQSRKEHATLAKQIALALEIPFTLMAPVFIGGIGGYFVDRWLHTGFTFMLVLGFVGFGIGIRDTLKALNAQEKREREEQQRRDQSASENDSQNDNSQKSSPKTKDRL